MLKATGSALRSVFRCGVRSGPAVRERRQSSRDTIKEHDEKLYGGRKSFDIVFSEAKAEGGRRLIGRWDWHLWQFLLSLVPAAGIYAFAQWARHDMQMNEDARKLTKENQSAAVPGSTDVSSLTARLESIELAIKNLQEAVNQVEGGLEEKKSNREIGKSTSKQPTKDQDCIIKGPITESDLKASVAQK